MGSFVDDAASVVSYWCKSLNCFPTDETLLFLFV